MKAAIVAVTALLITASLLAQQEKISALFEPGFQKSGDFPKFSKIQKQAYVWGFVNGLSVINAFGVPQPRVEAIETCFKEMTDEQIAAILEKHINANPETWHVGLNMESLNALIGICRPLGANYNPDSNTK